MRLYRSRPSEVEAVRWYPGETVDLPGFEVVVPEVVYSITRSHYYVTCAAAAFWLPVDPSAPGTAGAPLPFSFFEMKAGARRPAEVGDPMVERYLRDGYLGQRGEPTILGPGYGRIGGERVRPGDWLVRRIPSGRIEVMSPEAFSAEFEPVPDP